MINQKILLLYQSFLYIVFRNFSFFKRYVSFFLFSIVLTLTFLASVFVFSPSLFLCFRENVGHYKFSSLSNRKRLSFKTLMFPSIGQLHCILFVNLHLLFHWDKFQHLLVHYLLFPRNVRHCFDNYKQARCLQIFCDYLVN